MVPLPSARTIRAEEHSPQSLRRPWQAKLDDAFRGIKLGMRGQSSFAVQFFFAALIAAFALAVGCTPVEWCLLLGAIGFVVAAELFKSAIANLVQNLDEAGQVRAGPCLDIAAGAVLVATLVASAIGLIVFAVKVWSLLQHV